MIAILQPAMALNSEDMPGPNYKIWNTWEIPRSEDSNHI